MNEFPEIKWNDPTIIAAVVSGAYGVIKDIILLYLARRQAKRSQTSDQPVGRMVWGSDALRPVAVRQLTSRLVIRWALVAAGLWAAVAVAVLAVVLVGNVDGENLILPAAVLCVLMTGLVVRRATPSLRWHSVLIAPGVFALGAYIAMQLPNRGVPDYWSGIVMLLVIVVCQSGLKHAEPGLRWLAVVALGAGWVAAGFMAFLVMTLLAGVLFTIVPGGFEPWWEAVGGTAGHALFASIMGGLGTGLVLMALLRAQRQRRGAARAEGIVLAPTACDPAPRFEE
jgi:hypothetical protein